jgi:putative nucleotidyltransferase with HDIG domain
MTLMRNSLATPWIRGGSSPPTREECLRILKAYGVPPHITEHSCVVARLAGRLARDLPEEAVLSPFDPSRLEAGALLHDIAKRQGPGNLNDHAREGGLILRSLGLPELAPLVERHINPGQEDPSGKLREDEVLAYSDKRVMHCEIVGLKERFADLLERYGRLHGTLAHRIGETALRMERIEERIFRALPYPPASLASW